MTKKDLILSFIAGIVTALFLLLVFPNVKTLMFLEAYKIIFASIVPVVFVAGFLLFAKLSSIPHLAILNQVAKYGIVGVLNTAIDFGILNLLITYSQNTQGVWIAIFNVIAFGVAVINSYFWNRLWVFENSGKYGNVGEFMSFIIVSVLAIVLNTAIVYGLTTYTVPLVGLDPKTWANVAKVFATIFSMIWNFLGYKFVVFK